MGLEEDKEGPARTLGISPAARRLQLGMSAVVGRADGTVVELFPDGTEVVLHNPKEPTQQPDPKQVDNPGRQDF